MDTKSIIIIQGIYQCLKIAKKNQTFLSEKNKSAEQIINELLHAHGALSKKEACILVPDVEEPLAKLFAGNKEILEVLDSSEEDIWHIAYDNNRKLKPDQRVVLLKRTRNNLALKFRSSSKGGAGVFYAKKENFYVGCSLTFFLN